MKTFYSALLVALLIPLTGCINLSFGSSRKPAAPPAAPALVMPQPPLTPGDAATLAEIDAAARLNFDSAKKEALIQIAQRPGLSPAAQVHLVNVSYRCFSTDHSKVELLRTLIDNPGFSDAARQAIVAQLDHLSFDTHKQAILRRLNERLSGVPGAAIGSSQGIRSRRA